MEVVRRHGCLAVALLHTWASRKSGHSGIVKIFCGFLSRHVVMVAYRIEGGDDCPPHARQGAKVAVQFWDWNTSHSPYTPVGVTPTPVPLNFPGLMAHNCDRTAGRAGSHPALSLMEGPQRLVEGSATPLP